MYSFRTICARSAGKFFADLAHPKKSGNGLNKISMEYYSSSSTGRSKDFHDLSDEEKDYNKDDKYAEVFTFQFKHGDFKPLESAVYVKHKGKAAEKRVEVLKDLQLRFEDGCPSKKKKMQVSVVLDKNGDFTTAHGTVVETATI